MATSYLSLGSNMGDRLKNLDLALEALEADRNIKVSSKSDIYETSPVEYRDQPDFFNLVLEIETRYGPAKLLDACLAIETAMGRERIKPGGPRNIDIDILLYDNETINEPQITIPHPRLTKRAFVLVPLTDLKADITLPGGEKLQDFIPSTSSQQVRKLELNI